MNKSCLDFSHLKFNKSSVIDKKPVNTILIKNSNNELDTENQINNEFTESEFGINPVS